MNTLYRLKAYFGMVPAEDMDAYLDYDGPDGPGYHPDRGPDQDTYPRSRSGRSELADRSSAWGEHADGYADRYADRRPEPRQADRARAGRGTGEHSERPSRPVSASDLPMPLGTLPTPPGAAGSAGFSGGGRATPTRGALAVESMAEESSRSGPALLAVERSVAPGGVARELPLSRITTVHPHSYNEARTIGERYRDGIPVIMNLTELDDAAAKRLVDFAAGLAFALRGSIDKVTNRVFLLSPVGVDVSAEDRKKLAERGFFGQT